MQEKIKEIIRKYKDNFTEIDKGERYKWESFAHYNKHWNIGAEDFVSMLTEALKASNNLLAGGMYYPYKMAVEYAKEEPETVRGLFQMLYDETLPLDSRISKFRMAFENHYSPKKLNHYQDIRAISVYLSFEYPEKYYLYKYMMYKDFAKRIGFTESIEAKSDGGKYEKYMNFCNKVLAVIQEDAELIELSKERLDEKCYKDDALHLLTQDIIFYGSYAEDDEYAGYWPSLKEYDPKLSVEDWQNFLEEDKVKYPSTLVMLKAMLELGGEATCKHLGEYLGEHQSSCISRGSYLGKRVKEKFNLPACIDNQKERYFTIPFIGKYFEENRDLYVWKLRPELREALQSMDLSKVKVEKVMSTDVSKNTILYGPPGTGKTYNTVVYAVAIIENKPLATVKEEDYNDVLERYNQYKTDGLIEFTTFHQSYGYEDFIEGIKPVMDQDEEKSDIQYQVSPGIFKKFCERAELPVLKQDKLDMGLNSSPCIWKVSLEGTGANPTRTECMEKGHIRIGWDNYGENITGETDFAQGGKSVINAFYSKMKQGDIVLSCYSATTIDAIGVVTGEPEWHNEYANYKRLRKVNWIVKNINEDILEINNGTTLTLSSVYRLNISLSDVMEIVKRHAPAIDSSDEKKNYVFVIDEINRGNISKIFGELITLIEPSKRIGQKEGIKAKLPYSPNMFGVPDNVYIIGTMNTADRSIATIDTALRRRFRFKEMLPDAGVLENVTVEGIDVKEMLEIMNKRISVLYDREHTIGHAYFIPLKSDSSLEQLSNIFSDNIIPLLQEYFYEDYEKIRLVLGDNMKKDPSTQFIKTVEYSMDELFGNGEYDFDTNTTYEINKDAFRNPEAYRMIYTR